MGSFLLVGKQIPCLPASQPERDVVHQGRAPPALSSSPPCLSSPTTVLAHRSWAGHQVLCPESAHSPPCWSTESVGRAGSICVLGDVTKPVPSSLPLERGLQGAAFQDSLQGSLQRGLETQGRGCGMIIGPAKLAQIPVMQLRSWW